MALITKDDVKAYLKLYSGTAEDAMLDHLIEAATSEMEQAHHRKYEYGTHTETLAGRKRYVFLHAFPVQKIHSVVADGRTLSPSQYDLNRDSGILEGHWPYEEIVVTYEGGFWTDPENPAPDGVPVLPPDIRHECLERVAYLYQHRQGRR